MPIQRCIMSFINGEHGWTEEFYTSAGDDNAALVLLQRVVPTRLRLLGKSSYLQFLRCSNIDSARDAAFGAVAGFTGQGQWPTSPSTDWAINTAINTRLFASPSIWRSYLIRGLGSTALTYVTGGGLSPSQDFNTAFANYFAALQAAGIQILQIVKSAASPIQGFVFSPLNQLLQVNTAAAILLPTNPIGRLLLKGVLGVSGVNGVWRLSPLSAPLAYAVLPKKRLQYGTPIVNSGRVYLLGANPATLASYAIVGVTERKTGRPLYLPRGRAAVRVI
jgi:hypothetical protein